jgi:hypothetical protein
MRNLLVVTVIFSTAGFFLARDVVAASCTSTQGTSCSVAGYQASPYAATVTVTGVGEGTGTMRITVSNPGDPNHLTTIGPTSSAGPNSCTASCAGASCSATGDDTECYYDSADNTVVCGGWLASSSTWVIEEEQCS